MKSNSIIEWAMHNFRIPYLIMIMLFGFGIYAISIMPKQEFPEFTIRQGVVVGIYPGATSEEVEEQLTKPLERYLFTFKEVKRAKTTSTSENGMCYIMVELNDDVNNKDEVWSKIKHGLAAFKQQLPSGVLAVQANDDFGDTSALLIAIESNSRSYRELEKYSDELGDRLRRIESVSNIRVYGNLKEQISIYVDRNRLAAYGLNDKIIPGILASQGLTTGSSAINNKQEYIPIHLSANYESEKEIAEQIIYNDADGHIVRLKDIARITREYDTSENYIENNGNKCIILSMEMKDGYNIVQYGKEVDQVLNEYRSSSMPEDVSVSRIADQAKVVDESVTSFLHDLVVSMIIIIAVMMILFPFRSALVASITVPLSTFISVGIMYMFGIPLNTVTLAALIVVLGMIVDNSIVVIDGYLEYLNKGMSRWHAAIKSAEQYYMPMLLATVCICMIFFPLLFTLTGQTGDFVTNFPWTITINLMVSLILAVLIMPLLEFILIKRQNPSKKKKGKRITDYVQGFYEKVLQWTFRHGWLTIGMGVASVILSTLIVPQLKFRLMPFADRDQFAVEIYLPKGKGIAKTEQIADSIYNLLKADKRVTSITSFIGCSSPRFQMSYAPQMASRNYAQFIVNTTSAEDTEDILDEYADKYSEKYPDAFVKFKQLDYQTVPSLEFRFYGEDIDSLHRAADMLMDSMRVMPELMWVHSDYGNRVPIADVKLDAVKAPQLGISRAGTEIDLSMATNGINLGNVWEGDYSLPIMMKNKDEDSISLGDIKNINVPAIKPTQSVPLRQIADVSTIWTEEKIIHRNGMRCISVSAELRRDANALTLISRIDNMIKVNMADKLPAGVTYELGGEYEYDMETLPPIMSGIGISLIIIFFFILINFKKFGITIVSMLSMSLCLFGAMIGLWISGKTISITSVFGFITLLGMIVRNVILMYQHAEDLRIGHKICAHDAAYDAGKRRMVPIFLTTATTAAGVIPMITGGSTFWMPVGVTIFAGGIGSLILLVTILPVLYWKIYK